MLASIAVQAERAEGVVEDLLERLAHQALAGELLVGVVAEVGGLEGAADDLGDREDAGDRAASRCGGQQAQEVLAARAAVELVELVGALGRVGPRPVQPPALAGQREELGPVLAGEHAQADPRAGRRVGRDRCRRGGRNRPGGGGGRGVSWRSRQSKRTRDESAAIASRAMTDGRDRRAGRRAAGARRGGALGARAVRAPAVPARSRRRRALSHRAGHAWEQFVLPVQSARARRAAVPGEPRAGGRAQRRRDPPRRRAAAPSRLVLRPLRAPGSAGCCR